MTKKILWFSRHSMTNDQLNDLKSKLGNDLDITQVNGSPANVHVPFEGSATEPGETIQFQMLGSIPPLKELVQMFNESCMVLPIGLLQQILPFIPSGRVIQAKNKRVMLDDGKVQFVHDGWEQITEIKIVKTDL